ncbi:hypothetical protein D3C72_1340750 [compost metagenome]
MRNVKHGHALCPDVPDDIQQRVRFDGRKARRRLIENDHAMRHEQNAGDLRQLPLGNRQAADNGVRIDRTAKIGDRLAGAGAHGAVVHHGAPAYFAAEIDVLRHRQIGRQQYFLMHENNAAMFSIHGAAQRHGFAIDADFSARRLFIAGQKLHQRRLAGTVLAYDRVDLTGTHRDLDILQNLYRPERLRQPNRPDKGMVWRFVSKSHVPSPVSRRNGRRLPLNFI